ncbi:hypothetical protein DEO72_LG3g893 [Vigna unguiculata]|uniref:Uncharacterized protein n=1 Tax=Vigna unguiculata TaxID=3917 RepID=A0A4D6LCQ4_VIGUN|nr:hypothetical protein DEO72_LG3g893 [Vigna unguiculata]
MPLERTLIPILPRLICLGWPGTEAYNGAVAFLQLEPSFRPRFSKYPKPKRGIGRGSLKTGAKDGYRPRSSRTRSQKVVGSQGFKIREPFFLPALAPLQFHSLSLRCTHCHHTLQPPSTSSDQRNHHAASPLHFASLSVALSLSRGLCLAPTSGGIPTTPAAFWKRPDDGSKGFNPRFLHFQVSSERKSSHTLILKARIQIWLFKQKDLRIEGRIIVSTVTTCIGHWQNIV